MGRHLGHADKGAGWGVYSRGIVKWVHVRMWGRSAREHEGSVRVCGRAQGEREGSMRVRGESTGGAQGEREGMRGVREGMRGEREEV